MKLNEMPPQDLKNIPQSPELSVFQSQSPPPYTSPAVPSSPYVNLNPGGDGPPTPAYVQHGSRPSLGSRPQRGSCNNRSTTGSVSTVGDTSPYSAGSTMGFLRPRVNTDMTTLTASYRPMSPGEIYSRRPQHLMRLLRFLKIFLLKVTSFARFPVNY